MNPRDAKLEQIARLRSLVKRSIVDYLDANGWLEVTCSTLTTLTGACENISTVFILEHFDRKAHLAQTAQLQLEMLVKYFHAKVWTLARSFRAEPRVTGRHLTEFSMVELEAPHFSLSKIIATQEDILQQCLRALERDRSTFPEPVRQRLDVLKEIEFPLNVVPYSEAISILQSLGQERKWGDNLDMNDELALLAHMGGKPFFLTMFPSEIKYFNMRRADDGTVFSVDLIAPPFGEISGGAEREDQLDRLVHNLHSSQMWRDIERSGLDQDDFRWYLDLWQEGSPGPRGGFGMGFERLIGFLTGYTDIRDCTEFPRNRATLLP